VPPLGEFAVDQPHSFVMIHHPCWQGFLLNPDKKVAHVMALPNHGPRNGKGGKGMSADAAPGALDAIDSPKPLIPMSRKNRLAHKR